MALTVRVLFCCAMACASCADALGLHDLTEGDEAGSSEAVRASSTDGGANSAAAASVPLDGGREGKAHEVVEAGGIAPANPPGTLQSDAVDAGRDDADLGPSRADAVDARRDDADLGPLRVDAVDAGHDGAGLSPPRADAAGIEDSATKEAEGAAPGCSECGSSGCTAHSNGVGQIFRNCQPIDTYNATQALAACAALTGDSATCAVVSCSGGGPAQRGEANADQAACSTGAAVCD